MRLAADPDRVLVYSGSRAVTDGASMVKPAERPPLRVRLALRDIDGVTLLVLPAVLFVVALFVYPFALWLRAVVPAEDGRLARQLPQVFLRPVPVRHHRGRRFGSPFRRR